MPSRSRSNLRPLVVKGLLLLAAAVPVYWAVGATRSRTAVAPTGAAPAEPLLRAAPLVLRPYPGFADKIPQDDLEKSLESLEPYWADRRFGDLLHALRLWGPTATFPAQSAHLIPEGATAPGSREMLSYYLDERSFRSQFPDFDPYFFRTAHGVAARQEKSSPAANVHRDDFLEMAAEVGLPRDTAFTWGDAPFTLEDLFRHSFRWFHLDQEIEFSAVAYALYLPPGRSWTNRFDETFTFDQLADKLVRRDLNQGACLGTHVPYALAVLLAVDGQQPILAPAVRERVENHLKKISQELVENQGGAGWWDRRWVRQRYSAKPSEDELDEWVRSTGHHLEWIALVRPELRPPDANVEKAIRFVVEVLRYTDLRTLSPAKRYAPFSHAGRALALLAGKAHGEEAMTAAWARRGR